MCARCLKEGIFIPVAKRLRRKAQSLEVSTVIAPNVESSLEIEVDKSPSDLYDPAGGNQLWIIWSLPIPLVINLTFSVTVLIVNLFQTGEI